MKNHLNALIMSAPNVFRPLDTCTVPSRAITCSSYKQGELASLSFQFKEMQRLKDSYNEYIRVIKDSIGINPLACSKKIDVLRNGMAIALQTNKLLLETPTLTTSINPRSLLIRSPKSNTKWHRMTAFSPRDVRLIVSRSIDLLSSCQLVLVFLALNSPCFKENSLCSLEAKVLLID